MAPQSDSQLLRSAPYFPVADVEKAAAHYERVLGFRREYVGGTPAQFAILTRDGLPVMLRRVPAPERISPNEKQGGTWDAFFWVRDARALHAEMRAKGADVVYGPVVQDTYQMEEFAVRDSEGYVLGFGQAIESGVGSR
jgi:catechol 2,3-dioxygenase-like lactoylglutathione lyase family enzyme